MLRFIAYAWDADDPAQSHRAAAMRDKTFRDRELANVFDARGIAVYATGFGHGSVECYKLDDHAGIVLGALFRRNAQGQSAHVESLAGAGHTETTPSHLTRQFWGRYVAFLRSRETGAIFVLQDPSAGMSIYRARIGGVFVYFAELWDCLRLTGARFEVDWEYIAAHAAMLIHQARATALKGIEELSGGEYDEIIAGRVTARVCWALSSFATERIADIRDAAYRLRHVVKDCVNAWASLYQKILVRYSGGLDSSILLFCLKDAPTAPELTCVTDYGSGPGFVDEREYAQIGVEAASCRWIVQHLGDAESFEILHKAAPSPRPQVHLSALFERDLVAVAHQAGAQVIASGNGGDAEFFEMADIRVASDYVYDHGVGGDFWSVMRSTAQLTQTAMPRVVRHALLARFKPPRLVNLTAGAPQLQRMLTDSARAAVLTQPDRYAPTATRDLELPACKALHIRLMSQPMTVRPPLAIPSDPEYGHWLASQPTLECCAAMPTYLLTQGGRTRSVARAAFADEVPAALLTRRSKGNPASLVRRLVKHNRPFVSACLQSGWLVEAGVLDANLVQAATDGTATNIDPWEVLCHVNTEVWLSRVDELQRAAAT